ncbi:hypothetical protein ACJRPK_16150 [Aquimarina sp. 2-A2]|uniref:PepSY domain-containing protein n=1 Tax=Aquimarina intermedia TaxID=350814 RepID=A0A5S5C0Y1_9FLAO|nr:hypothetical protein [Aquimarina intermedia]TYP71623.1 hypothetical protein BD809_10833 [Aquimarina intermedia]
MKHCLLLSTLFLVLTSIFTNADAYTASNSVCDYPLTHHIQNPRDRKLSDEEVQQRGIDMMVNQVMANIDGIDFKAMARSDIFETTYGFRWKMFNLQTGKMIAIKVNKDFKLLDVIK